MSENNPATQLIAVEIEHPEFAQLLNDIRDFDWKLINRLRKEDLARIASTGFRFTSKGIENQRMELKSFLLNHPSCMASDFEMIVSKLQIFSLLWNGPRPKEPVRPAIPQEKKKKKAKKVIVIEEEEEETFEASEPSESSEEEEIKPRRGRKWY